MALDARQVMDWGRSRTYKATVLIICKQEEEVRLTVGCQTVITISQLISLRERWLLALGLDRWSLVGWLHAGTSRAESAASAP